MKEKKKIKENRVGRGDMEEIFYDMEEIFDMEEICNRAEESERGNAKNKMNECKTQGAREQRPL